MLLREYGPLCEMMFLAMSADGKIEQTERDVIRGALRELDDRIRTTHFGEMLRKPGTRTAVGRKRRRWRRRGDVHEGLSPRGHNVTTACAGRFTASSGCSVTCSTPNRCFRSVREAYRIGGQSSRRSIST